MNASAFLLELNELDIRVSLDGDELRCDAASGVMTPELRERLRQRKYEIVEFLREVDALAGQERTIIPLQSRGDRTPIFAIGGHKGNAFAFRALAQHAALWTAVSGRRCEV